MASSQVACSKVNTIHVQPKDLSISWGLNSQHWRLATDCNPTAELKSVCFFRVIGRVPINPLKKNHVTISFEVLKTKDTKGWDHSNVTIGVKVGESSVTEDGNYFFKNVNCQLQNAKVGEFFLVSEKFDLKPNNSSNDNYLYFGLFDKPLNEKGELIEKRGLVIYDTSVQVVEADP